jgi:hypothetical protein
MLRSRNLPTARNRSVRASSLQQSTTTHHATTVSKEDRKKRDLLLTPIVELLFQQKMSDPDHKLPYDAISNVVKVYKRSYDWITKDMLKSRLRRKYAKHKASLNNIQNETASITTAPVDTLASTNTSTPCSTSTATNDRKRGGRPIGSDHDSLLHLEKCEYEAKAEIVDLYQQAKQLSKAKGLKRVSKGTFQSIHDDVKKLRNLPDTFDFKFTAARKRISSSTVLDKQSIPVGNQSPLRDAEDQIIKLIVLLGSLGSPLTCGQGVFLINDLIKNTTHQKRLIEWKHRQGIIQAPEELGKIGSNYWYAFLRRNADKIQTKKGRKFELDRSKWTKYRNFKQMYDDVENEMIEAGVAVQLDSPIWMDEQGNSVPESQSKGFKVKVKLTRPDMCIVMDEVGSNLSMMKDGHAGGEKFVVGKGKEAKLKATKRDKRFTCLGLTLLSGEPLMCVILVDSTKEDLLIKTGVDFNSKEIENSVESQVQDEYDYLINNLGKGKQYPGGPSCYYEGQEIPCMVEFAPGGSNKNIENT